MTKHDYYQEDGDEGMPIINLDNSLDNADWTKKSWDLPPYKSLEFFQLYPVDQLDEFRKSPQYQGAVEAGLIHDDEWVDNHVRKIIPKE